MENNSISSIENLIGGVSFNKNNKILRFEKFIQTNINPGEIAVLYKETIYSNLYEGNENGYHFEIEYVCPEDDNISYFNKTIRKPIETHFLILNKFKYIPFIKRFLPYEISWIKDDFLPFIKGWFKYEPVKYFKDISTVEKKVLRVLRAKIIINRIERIDVVIIATTFLYFSIIGFFNIIRSLYTYIFG